MKWPTEGQIIASGGLIAALIGSLGEFLLANRIMLVANLLVIGPAVWRYHRGQA
jgi:hypothetical protein